MTTIVSNLSTLTAAKFRRETVSDIQQRLDTAGQELSTGRRSDIHAAVGLRSSELLAVRSSAARNESFLSSNRLLANRLDTMAASMSGVRDTLQGFFEIAIANRGTPGPTVQQVSAAARAAYDQVVAQLNAPYQGAQLFSGTDSGSKALQGWQQAHAGTGLSPEGILAGIVGAGLSDAADAAAKLAEIDLVFASANAGAPATNFEASFYNGTPALDALAAPSPRVSARIDEATVLQFGVQANDAAFTSALQGLAMFASVDPASFADDGAYAVWVGAALDRVAAGIDDIIGAEGQLGTQQRTLDETMRRQQDRGDLYGRHIVLLENVDPYEAATRVTELSAQLEAAYAVTARISRLSFLDYM
ncbi:flagellin [Roseibacterium sp. SDUM158017]|uniref:flagellin n=1 Tax=Roseicyclus salinarum TaxID=3036773 RepID=UPI0024151D42|nr:flagellin [Roseibacterium sp. SDUM158017]MDG4648647.1 flagellin [Roseibacterium sp. SDUM158017]